MIGNAVSPAVSFPIADAIVSELKPMAKMEMVA